MEPFSPHVRFEHETTSWDEAWRRLSSYTTPLLRCFQDNVFPITFAGTSFRVRFCDRYLLIATAHQQFDTEQVAQIFHIRSERRSCFMNPAEALRINPDAVPGQLDDLMVMDYTGAVRMGYFSYDEFCPLRIETNVKPSERVVGLRVLGFPDADQTLRLADDEMGSFDGWTFRAKLLPARPWSTAERQPGIRRLKFHEPFPDVPTGISGSPVITLIQGPQYRRMSFDGIITTAGPELASYIPVEWISRLLKRMVAGIAPLSRRTGVDAR